MTPQIFHVDAFTTTPFTGNSAGVVLHADGLTAMQMQQIARELRHSETAFLLKPLHPGTDVHIRYFTPTTEVPICGHATIAAHYVRASVNESGNCSVSQSSAAGIHTIHVTRTEEDYSLTMEQGEIMFGEPLDASVIREIARALGLGADGIVSTLPTQIVSTGHSKVMVPLADTALLDALHPDNQALSAISSRIGCNGFFPFAILPSKSETAGRMFAPAIGIPEDPVTGNANGPLGAYLVKHELMSHDGNELTFRGYQGRQIGREGVVDVRVEIENGQPSRVLISGRAVILFRATAEFAC
ncbi:PhzF family isomerase [Salmonella enterica]|uniref:PhzF family isomerase n=1 Tax=Salmonella enterica TaxID=28901 RepID=A0A628V7N2_SALER|nr:PhzF family isomerase [Salmonella enterica]EEC6702114.1 PhzF family isomerase [Salmonella enterica]ELF5201577.1 PhzF family isomerase [Salmonella enterica]